LDVTQPLAILSCHVYNVYLEGNMCMESIRMVLNSNVP
jgi:hypothetical protein